MINATGQRFMMPSFKRLTTLSKKRMVLRYWSLIIFVMIWLAFLPLFLAVACSTLIQKLSALGTLARYLFFSLILLVPATVLIYRMAEIYSSSSLSIGP